MISSKERLSLALSGLPVDVIPFSPNLAYMFDTLPPEIRNLGHLGICRLIGADLLNRFAPPAVKFVTDDTVRETLKTEPEFIRSRIETPVGALEKVWHHSDSGNTDFLIEHPLKSETDYKTELYILEHTRPVLDLEPSRQCLAGAPEGLHIGMLIPEHVKSAFQYLVEHLTGTGQIFYDLMDFPDTFHAVYAALRDLHRRAAELALDSDYEYFLTWEDSGTQNYSPQLYAEYIAPEIAEWCALLKPAGKKYIQHSCGYSRELLGMMRDGGVHAVESLATYPTGNLHLREARAKLGAGIGIIGGIDPVELLNRNGDNLLAYAEEVIAEGRGGPFILANSDSCPHGVTLEKLRAVAELAHRTPY
jgi:hypothetical protein